MRRLIALFFVFAFAYNLYAQDIIVLCDATEIEAKVVDIGQSVVVYKRLNDPNETLIAIDKAKIFYVKRADGRKDYLSGNRTVIPTESMPLEAKVAELKRVKAVKFRGYTCGGLIFMHSDLYGIAAGPIFDISLGVELYKKVYIGATLGLYTMFASKHIGDIKIKSSEVLIPLVPLSLKFNLPIEQRVDPFIEFSLGAFVLHSKVSAESLSVTQTARGLFMQAGIGFNVKEFSFGVGYTGLKAAKFAHLGYVKLGANF